MDRQARAEIVFTWWKQSVCWLSKSEKKFSLACSSGQFEKDLEVTRLWIAIASCIASTPSHAFNMVPYYLVWLIWWSHHHYCLSDLSGSQLHTDSSIQAFYWCCIAIPSYVLSLTHSVFLSPSLFHYCSYFHSPHVVDDFYFEIGSLHNMVNFLLVFVTTLIKPVCFQIISCLYPPSFPPHFLWILRIYLNLWQVTYTSPLSRLQNKKVGLQ